MDKSIVHCTTLFRLHLFLSFLFHFPYSPRILVSSSFMMGNARRCEEREWGVPKTSSSSPFTHLIEFSSSSYCSLFEVDDGGFQNSKLQLKSSFFLSIFSHFPHIFPPFILSYTFSFSSSSHRPFHSVIQYPNSSFLYTEKRDIGTMEIENPFKNKDLI